MRGLWSGSHCNWSIHPARRPSGSLHLAVVESVVPGPAGSHSTVHQSHPECRLSTQVRARLRASLSVQTHTLSGKNTALTVGEGPLGRSLRLRLLLTKEAQCHPTEIPPGTQVPGPRPHTAGVSLGEAAAVSAAEGKARHASCAGDELCLLSPTRYFHSQEMTADVSGAWPAAELPGGGQRG